MADVQTMEKRRTFCAPCNIYREDSKVVLTMEMPGVSKDELEVKIDGNLLILHGSKKAKSLQGRYRVKEIPEGDFHQEYTIDDTIDRERIEARMEKGILTLTLYIKESEKPRKIKVKAL
ncbi:Hsp20/alpha crystallin family protein [Oceanispirochaeta crateris]|jgi:HSP20 family protein|uniref:Hsp20/alpha crystallin family protein n=1 Tax=Oceanispirochaeta crateris TaxID=2518645 RepID=A0A5C1QEQ8_9SPIO|nr:Hsp20/alpha crystallin family protein [Oceanispirochaeta crateris]QEN06543.1 Hsp20/alpha crystallin family protein [Oceanispirochaeta crateris]